MASLDDESVTFDVDSRGWLWRGGNRGLSVADPVAAEAGKWIFLNQADGLSGVGINSGSYFADTDGSLWFGIDVSVFHYSPPDDLVHPRFSPQVFVSAFSSNGSPPRLSEEVFDLPHGTNVVAHIGSLQFDRRHALRLRYRLLPEQRDWRETTKLDLPLGEISWGSHTLEVQGRVFTGPWSDTVSRSLKGLRPIWLSWPFIFDYLLASVSVVLAFYLVQRNHLLKARELLPNLNEWRLAALVPDVNEFAGVRLEGRFDVGDLIARGGFANVMLGYDNRQKRRCAVKIFRREVRDNEWVMRHFKDEVASLRQVHHPNVVGILAHGITSTKTPYLVMEFIDGKSLRTLLQDGPLSPGRTAAMLHQLGSALDAIHEKGIFHRDLKPENVMVRKEGTAAEQAILIDFSIAIVKDADESLHGLSRAGGGTFDYMAPEQAIGYAQTSSDVYSLAKLVLEMLAGRRLSLMLPHASFDLPDRVRELADDLNVNLSAESMEMFASALQFDPKHRPAVASVFAKPIVRDLDNDSNLFTRRLN